MTDFPVWMLDAELANRRATCRGSAQLEHKYLTKRNIETKAPTKPDRVRYLVSKYLQSLYDQTCEVACEDEELTESAGVFAGYVFSIFPDLPIENIAVIVNAFDIHELTMGFVDAFNYVEKTNELHIFKYHHGHKHTEIFQNLEFIELASGVLTFLKNKKLKANPKVLTFHLIQPRTFHSDGPISTWVISSEDFNASIVLLKNIEEESISLPTSSIFNPTSECLGCAGRSHCTALQQAALRSLELLTYEENEDLSNESLGSELRLLKNAEKLLSARINGLEVEAEYKLKNGQVLPYFTLENGRGVKKWKLPPVDTLQITDSLGFDLRKPIDIITPTQAEKILPKKSIELINDLSEKVPGSLKLVPINEIKIKKQLQGENL